MGSSDSLSLPSEPPDIGNWFSSYVYQSPEFNSADDFKDSGCSELAETGDRKKEIEEDFHQIGAAGKDEKSTSNGVLNCKSLPGCDKRASQVLESADSLSQFSEPPDVKNWFSSYVYESPALDTYHEFRSHPIENEREKGGTHASNCNGQKEEESINITKAVELHDLEVPTISSDGISKCSNSFGEKEFHQHHFAKDSQKASRNKNLNTLNAPAPEWLPHQILDKSCGLAKDSEISFISGSSPGNFGTKVNTKASSQLLVFTSTSGSKQGGTRKPFQSSDPTEESFRNGALAEGMDLITPAEKLNSDVGNQKPMNKPAGGHANKENDGNEYAESGFISTRKSKQSEERNSFRKPIKNEFKIPSKGNKEAVETTRKALSETTNFQASNMLESAGKWRCPQKSKPYLGPPLKQLRLEQWVRRV